MTIESFSALVAILLLASVFISAFLIIDLVVAILDRLTK